MFKSTNAHYCNKHKPLDDNLHINPTVLKAPPVFQSVCRLSSDDAVGCSFSQEPMVMAVLRQSIVEDKEQ